MFNKIPPVDGMKHLQSWMPTEDIKETFKKLTQQQNHKIDLCKKELQNTSRRKAK